MPHQGPKYLFGGTRGTTFGQFKQNLGHIQPWKLTGFSRFFPIFPPIFVSMDPLTIENELAKLNPLLGAPAVPYMTNKSR